MMKFDQCIGLRASSSRGLGSEERQGMCHMSQSKTMKKAIQNQEWSPDDSPHVNIFYCMGSMADWVVQLAVAGLYVEVRCSNPEFY
jgi:hypothetical protein